jgi:hypothetical protein
MRRLKGKSERGGGALLFSCMRSEEEEEKGFVEKRRGAHLL